MDQKIAKKVMLPTVGVLGLNGALQWVITGSLKGTPQYGLQAADGVAFAGQAVVSGIAWKMYGPIPGIMGLLEAVFFIGLKLVNTPSLPIKPMGPTPNTITSAVNSLAPGLLTTVEKVPAASNFLKQFGIAGLALSQFNN